MELEQLEKEAKLGAIKEVKNMLLRSGHLEKVDRYKSRTVRKKASLEAQLKTAMQNQLDGVRVGQTQLENSLNETRYINVL